MNINNKVHGKKRLLVLFVAGSTLAVGGALYAYQNISDKPTIEVPQTSNTTLKDVRSLKESDNVQVLRSGEFTDGDAVHKASGTVQVISQNGNYILSLEDFKVLDGPDLFVYLSSNAAGEDLGKYASLGRLKSPSGNQTYNLPDNYTDYKTIVIWCRAFGVTFATAELK